MRESELYRLVAEYLQVQYPEVIYRFDLAADLKLTPGQAVRHKRLHPHRGYPDLFIAESKDFDYGKASWYRASGLFVELKKDGTRLKKKNGEWATQHIAEQAEVLDELKKRYYRAEFAVGFEEAKKLIDGYLGGEA